MVNVYIATGFEEVEALTVVDVLRRGGCEACLISITGDKLVTSMHQVDVRADLLFEEADHDNAEMLVLPGGMPGSKYLDECAPLGEKLKAFASAGRPVAAICAAPMVLGHLGILEGKKATIYPGMEENLVGAEATGEAVTVDGNIITGQGPAKALVFALAVLEALRGKEAADAVASGMIF